MLFVFRVDASSKIGSGHVMRCLTLASAVQTTAEVIFISREHDGHLCELIESKGFKLYRLAKPHQKDALSTKLEEKYLDWLGVSIQTDISETQSILRLLSTKPDWLIVDHYAIDEYWETAMRPFVGKIMVIDDLANRQHDCDLLLDQNLVHDKENRYTGKVPESCKLLLGPQYALLQPIYAQLHKQAPERRGLIRQILVYFGAADNANLTGRVLSALLELDFSSLLIDVVLPDSHPYSSDITEKVRNHKNVVIHRYVESLAPLMLKADLAIGACGATAWERLCLKLPSLVITLAENQVPIAKYLEEENLVTYMGSSEHFSEQEFKAKISSIINSDLNIGPAKYYEIDGNGTNKIADLLLLSEKSSLKIRPAVQEDVFLLFQWVNDQVVRENAFKTEKILFSTHREWFLNRIDSNKCHIYILEAESQVPIGQVRFEYIDGNWVIDYSIDKFFRGKKLGKKILEISISEFSRNHQNLHLVGRVKKENIVSCHVFESLKFKKNLKQEVIEYTYGL